MMIDAEVIVAILTRQPAAERLIGEIEAAPPPVFVSPLSVVEAVMALARRRAGPGSDWAATLAQARAAVTEFLDVVGAREVILSADLGRRALDQAAAGEASVERCFALACASAYRTRLPTL